MERHQLPLPTQLQPDRGRITKRVPCLWVPVKLFLLKGEPMSCLIWYSFISCHTASQPSEAIPKHRLTLNKLNMKWECRSLSSVVDSTGVRQGIFTQDKNSADQKLMYKKRPQHMIRLAMCRSLLYVNQINTKYSVGIIFQNGCIFVFI